MRILLISRFQSNLYCTGHHLFKALIRLGHSTVHLDFADIQINKKIVSAGDDFDLMIVWKGSTLDPEMISTRPYKTVLWYCDDLTTLHGTFDVNRLGAAYDYVFTPIEEDLPDYKERFNINVKFLPVGPEKDDFEDVGAQLNADKYSVSFVGNLHSDRLRLQHMILDTGKYADAVFTVAYGAEYDRIIRQTKINLNLGWGWKGTQLRIFEIIARGGFLLTNETNFIREHFQVHVGMFNKDNILKRIDYYLKDVDRRRHMATCAKDIAKASHLWEHRFMQMFREIGC